MADMIWDANEQIDFDYLLNLTSQKFVDVITDEMDLKMSFKGIKVTKNSDSTVDVIVVREAFVRVFTWYSFNDSFDTTLIAKSDLSWVLEVINND